MKKIVTLFLIAFPILLGSCSDNGKNLIPSLIEGEWEYFRPRFEEMITSSQEETYQIMDDVKEAGKDVVYYTFTDQGQVTVRTKSGEELQGSFIVKNNVLKISVPGHSANLALKAVGETTLTITEDLTSQFAAKYPGVRNVVVHYMYRRVK